MLSLLSPASLPPPTIFYGKKLSYPIKAFLTYGFGGSKLTSLSILFSRNPQLLGANLMIPLFIPRNKGKQYSENL